MPKKKKSAGKQPAQMRWEFGPDIIVRISIVLFVAALCVPAVMMGPLILDGTGQGRGPEWRFGIACLLVGWHPGGLTCVAWLGNPFLFVSWVFFMRRNWGASCASSVISMMFALLTIVMFFAPMGKDRTFHILALGPGFYVWLGSMVLQVYASILALRWSNRKDGQ